VIWSYFRDEILKYDEFTETRTVPRTSVTM
jgi:hypothetical protein